MDTCIAETGVCLPTTLNTVPAVLTLLHLEFYLFLPSQTSLDSFHGLSLAHQF